MTTGDQKLWISFAKQIRWSADNADLRSQPKPVPPL